MKIGFAHAPITPAIDRPVFLAGFARNRRATGVHDDLEVRALSLTEGKRTVVLTALDLIGFFRPDVQEVAARVSEAMGANVELLIASTHTHHGPDTLGLWGPSVLESGVDPVYMNRLKDIILETVCAAVRGPQAEAAGLVAAAVRVPGVAKNTRDPAILDNELAVARFVNEAGQPLATICDFPCHPEAVTDVNTHITADYAGALRRAVEAETGAPCIFFPGALGGMMTPNVVDHSFEECEAMGVRLATEASRAVEGIEPQPLSGLALSRTVVTVPLRNPLFEMAFAAGLLPDSRTPDGDVVTSASLLRIGGLWLAAVPGELLPKLGLTLKDEMRRAGATVPAVIALADDEIGYILPAEDYVAPLNWLDPGDQYEESMSLGPDAGPAVVAAVRSLL